MSAHEGVVATVVLAVVHMPVSSSGPSIAAGCAILGLQVRRVALFRIGLHSPMRNRELHRTMDSFLAADGLRGLQPRNKGAADAYHVKTSAKGHLGLDHAGGSTVPRSPETI